MAMRIAMTAYSTLPVEAYIIAKKPQNIFPTVTAFGIA
jgi:hypothetical protein